MSTPPPIPDALMTQIRQQVDVLSRSCDAYDAGRQAGTKLQAVALMALFHDTETSRSLLGQVEGLHGKFFSTAIPNIPATLSKRGGLINAKKPNDAATYFAPLDSCWFMRWLPFPDWWNERVYVDEQKSELTRRDVVLAIAGKDDANQQSIPERSAIRQIGHEALRTLIPAYRKRSFLYPRGTLDSTTKLEAGLPPGVPQSQFIRRLDLCPCGGGKRYKSCHGGS